MNNRSNIKWAPFNSVINGVDVIKDIELQHKRMAKPTLSEEQINILEEKIIESYTEHKEINLLFYYNSYKYKTTCIITNIDRINKKIQINNRKWLYFTNILSIF